MCAGSNGVDIEVDGPGPHVIDWRARSRSWRDRAPSFRSRCPTIRICARPITARCSIAADELRAPTATATSASASQGRRLAGDPDRLDRGRACSAGTTRSRRAHRHDGDGGRRRARRRRPARDLLALRRLVRALDAEKREVDKTGRLTAAEVVKHRRDRCPVIVDLGGGWGGDALIALKDNGIEVVAFNGVEATTARTRDGKLQVSQQARRGGVAMREALDPEPGGRLGGRAAAGPELKADLAPIATRTRRRHPARAEGRSEGALGRSPDKGDAAMMCLSEGSVLDVLTAA
jgi:hypothetical protein